MPWLQAKEQKCMRNAVSGNLRWRQTKSIFALTYASLLVYISADELKDCELHFEYFDVECIHVEINVDEKIVTTRELIREVSL